MFIISFFAATLVAVIANPEHEIIQNRRFVPIKTNGSDTNDFIQVRIIGGKPAGIEQSQYQVGLFSVPSKDSERGFLCGGTLISKQYVLTAAHCLVDKDNPNNFLHSTTVYLGARNRYNPYEEGQIRYYVTNANFIKHSRYDHVKLLNDIALIKLPTPVKFNAYIKPARLPSRRAHTKEYLVGKIIDSSGWGGKNVLQESSSQLLYMKTIIQPGNVCYQTYEDCYIEDRMICINARGRSTCLGDSGGPHIYKENGVKYVVGVTSYGSKSCVKGYPQVLTRVTYYLDWIAEKTGLRV